MTPGWNLLLAAALFLLLWLVFRPGRGFYWRWLRARETTERVWVEDALKHLYDCHYSGGRATVQSLAGAVQISANDAARLSATRGSVLSSDKWEKECWGARQTGAYTAGAWAAQLVAVR